MKNIQQNIANQMHNKNIHFNQAGFIPEMQVQRIEINTL